MISKRGRRIAVTVQCWLFCVLFGAAAIYFAVEAGQEYIAHRIAVQKLAALWRDDPGLYGGLGYHPPFHAYPTIQILLVVLLAILCAGCSMYSAYLAVTFLDSSQEKC